MSVSSLIAPPSSLSSAADIRLRKLAQVNAILRTGVTQSFACAVAGVARSTWQRWRAAFEKDGFDGLKPARLRRWNRGEELP